MADPIDAGSPVNDWKDVDDWQDVPSGEAGGPGHEPYTKAETAKQRGQSNHQRAGDAKDAAISWANRAALGGGPQIAGAIGAVAHAATNPMQQGTTDVDAYRDVRDAAAKRIASASDTLAGDVGGVLGAMSTPGLPAVAKEATGPERAWQATKVGAGVGGTSAAFSSPVDLTHPTPEKLARFAKDVGVGTAGGAGGGALAGGALAAGANPMRAYAEEQALRASGLQAGIKNSLKKDLGLKDMTEARALGRSFLDEDLIPLVGSSEAVAERAHALENQAGTSQQAVLQKAEMSGTPLDFKAAADRGRKGLAGETAVAEDLAGGKARDFLDSFEKQEAKTPGSYLAANKAKSDGWKTANFAADAPLTPQLHRKAVGAVRDDIERQVEAAIGPEEAAALRSANQKYGVAADALKLAENESQRRAGRKGFTVMDALAALGGAAAGGTTGHTAEGAALTAAGLLGLKGADKYGHASASRFADFLANRSGGGTGGQGGATAFKKFLEDQPEATDEPWSKLRGGR